jgi:MarR family transcriptional regulator, lower aerobic nicotinate degradation pathway regulator
LSSIVAGVTSSPDVAGADLATTADDAQGNAAQTDEAQTDEALVDAVAQLSFAMQLVLTDVGAPHGLSVTQLRLLMILRDRTLSMGELATYLRLDRSSVTGLVGRAEQRDLVRRERRHEDGRGVQVLITGRGLELAAQMKAEVADRVLALTQMFSASERKNLTELIDRMVNVI